MLFETKQREYAVIAVLELARVYRSKRPLSARKIAAKYGFSQNFLTQVLQRLKEANLVEAVRGPLEDSSYSSARRTDSRIRRWIVRRGGSGKQAFKSKVTSDAERTKRNLKTFGKLPKQNVGNI